MKIRVRLRFEINHERQKENINHFDLHYLGCFFFGLKHDANQMTATQNGSNDNYIDENRKKKSEKLPSVFGQFLYFECFLLKNS